MSALSANRAYSKLELLRLMLLSREGDRREGILLRQSKGWFQVSGMGHEALAVIAHLLREDDWLFPYYRDRALMLARGLSHFDLALAYLAKKDSSSAGRQMPGHFSSRAHNVFSVCTPTGGGLLPACGTAWAMKLDGKDSVCLASVGDAAARQGEFFEAVAFALQENLPVVFVVEDNKYGISTPTEKFLPFHLDLLSDENVVKVDARHPDRVWDVFEPAITKARQGHGPTVVWADLDRLSSHTSSDDHRVYRNLEDIEAMAHRDPIRLLAEELIATGELTATEWEATQQEIVELVDAEYRRAERATDPDAHAVLDEVFAPAPPAEVPPISRAERTTMVQAINTTFAKGLESNPNMIFFGEDIEDPKGGVFGLTKGLSETFPKQVFNSPLAEATIMGVAVGMAAYGYRPVFELQFVDFMAPGWNQITSNMSTLRWRTNGDWKCPLVIYAPYGAYLPGGSLWHSQANESYLAHTPGLKIAIPSTPADAAGLAWTAMHGEDPHFLLIPKHIFRKPTPVEHVEPVPFGKARTVREGSDVTVVTWGNCIELVEEAAAQTNVSLEIIDLRSIVPCDYDAITQSVQKTGRLIVVHEDNITCGFGQTILAEMTRVPERWNLFLSPPQLVAREDVHIGYNPIYEYAALPSVDQVLDAIRVVMA
ncbi:MAG: thiamine pyrophosphate-dependent enzyme [Fimbriimonadaceae bacterium]|nr:thiamine pyrophosphate-dependent enzyme [Fimbriimonadaceae bacterium]